MFGSLHLVNKRGEYQGEARHESERCVGDVGAPRGAHVGVLKDVCRRDYLRGCACQRRGRLRRR